MTCPSRELVLEMFTMSAPVYIPCAELPLTGFRGLSDRLRLHLPTNLSSGLLPVSLTPPYAL